MPRRIRNLIEVVVLSAVLLTAWFWSVTAKAESKSQDAAMQQVMRKAQGVVRQLTQEKAALETEKAGLLSEKAALEAKVKGLEASVRQLEAVQAEVERYKSSLQNVKSAFEAQVSQGREREQSLLKKHRDVVTKAREIRADNELLVHAVQEREQWIGQCGERNQNLLQANREVVEKYKDKSFLDELGDIEPVTGIGSVATENVAEEYRYKLHQLKATPFQAETKVAETQQPAQAAEDEEEEDQ